MSDRRNGIGQIITDRHYGPGIADSCGIENGDGYLSDVQTYCSNNQSEVSQDFYSSARLLEQHFKDKYKFIRDTYDHRNRQLSEVVNRTCEGLISDDLLREMTVDKTCSAFVPAHIGEVINRHLDNEREQFIHQLITQLSNTKIDLLKSQEVVAHRSKSLAALEPEITRGKKAQSGMDNLQRQLLDMKRQFDNLSSHSEETISKLQTRNDYLTQQDLQSKEQLQRLLVDLSIKSDAVESLRKSIDEKIRGSSSLESSFEKAVDDEKNAKFAEVNEIRMQLRLQSDELVRTQEVLKVKIEEGQKSKVQLTAIMAQVEIMLEQEASESDKTIAALRDKTKQLKTRLSLELQQERRLTAVLQEELGNIRRDKEDKTRESRQATDDLLLLRDKLALELQRSATYHIKLQESQTALAESKARITEAENKTKEKEHELSNVNKLKDQELKVEFAKAKMLAVKELESERSSINAEVEKRTEAYKKNNENQLKVLQNQMRHSYSFGSTSQDFNKNVNDTMPWGGEGNLALDMSMQVAIRCAEEKARVSSIISESEHLISKAKSDAKMEIAHKETIQHLHAKLQEAAGHIDMLKKIAIKGKSNEEENSRNKSLLIELKTQNSQLKGKTLQSITESRSLAQKVMTLENERSFEKNCFLDLQKQLATAVQARTNSDRKYEIIMEETKSKNTTEETKNIEERRKFNEEKRCLQDEQRSLDEERTRIKYEKKKLMDATENFEEEYRNQNKKINNLDSFYRNDSTDDNQASRYSRSERNDDSEEQIFSLRQELSDVRKSLRKLLEERTQEHSQKEHSKDKFSNEEGSRKEFMMFDEEHSPYSKVHSRYGNLDQMLEERTRNEKEEEVEWGDIVITQEINERKWNENNCDNEQRSLQDFAEKEIRKLKNLLVITQEQAIADQKQDAFTLQEMNRKFDNLMHNYEVNVTAVSEKLDTSNAQSIETEDIITAQNETIRCLEQEILQKNTVLTTLSKDVETERTRSFEDKNKAEKFFIVMKEMYNKQLNELRTKLRKTRESIEDLDPMVDEEVRRLTAIFGETIQTFSINLTRTHENNVLTLSRTHQNNLKNLSRTHDNEVQTMRVTLSESSRIDRQNLESSYLSRFQTQDQKIQELEELIKENKRNFENQPHLQGQVTDFTGILEGLKSEESHGSLSASFLSDEGDVSAFESVMRGLLSALEGAGMFSNQEVEEMILLASENRHPSYIATSSAKSLLTNCLTKLSLDLKKSNDEVIHLQKELRYEISEAKREKDSAREREKLYEKERTILEGVDPSNMADYSEMNSVGSSSNNEAIDLAVEELQQAKLDQTMLLDLARIESDAQIKNLIFQIDDLKKSKEMEAASIRTEAFELEQILKASFLEEIESIKREANSSLESLKKEVLNEQSRRHLLQTKLTESETHLIQKINILEEKVILLQTMADQAELETTKAKMELLHSKVSSGL